MAATAESATLEILAQPAVRDFLATARVGSLATADAEATPHAVPLCFWFEDAHCYFVIDQKPKRRMGLALKRMRNIAANPRVALLVEHYEDDWNHLAYVLIHGAARVVDEADEYLFALRKLRDKYPQYRSMTLAPADNPVVRIDAERVHAWGRRFEAASVT
jgi:PPOX class probable F420-dependent enzyme